MSDAERLAVFEIPWSLTNGNQGRSKHYGSAARERRDVALLLRALYGRREPFAEPVMLVVTRVLAAKQRRWDLDSWQRGNLKELLDACVSLGWFHDDSQHWITHVAFNEDIHSRPVKSSIVVQVFTDVAEQVVEGAK